jgi:hypothetical protein
MRDKRRLSSLLVAGLQGHSMLCALCFIHFHCQTRVDGPISPTKDHDFTDSTTEYGIGNLTHFLAMSNVHSILQRSYYSATGNRQPANRNLQIQ